MFLDSLDFSRIFSEIIILFNQSRLDSAWSTVGKPCTSLWCYWALMCSLLNNSTFQAAWLPTSRPMSMRVEPESVQIQFKLRYCQITLASVSGQPGWKGFDLSFRTSRWVGLVEPTSQVRSQPIGFDPNQLDWLDLELIWASPILKSGVLSM